MSDTKIIHGNLDEIVEAVVNNQDKFIEYIFSSAIIDKDRLRTALERFVQPNEWISVEDRLPEKLQDVLVIRTNPNVVVTAFIHEWGHWVWSNMKGSTYKECVRHRITHWMPLPTTPKKGGEEQELIICGNCYCKHSNTAYDGYCSQSCFDGIGSNKKGGDDEG